MDSPISLFIIDQSKLNIRTEESLRYLGYRRELVTDNDRQMIEEYTGRIRKHMEPRGCYRRMPVEVKGDGHIVMPYGEIISHSLTRNLEKCNEIIFMAVTLGPGFDRALKRVALTSITEAACYQSIGGAAVEALCEELVKHISEQLFPENKKLRPRFSPGFSDYPLDNQRGIFSCLNPEKHIGVTLMDSLVMAPEKSVTAIIGIDDIEDIEA